MDRTTTSICEKPYGRASFARVLLEIDSNKPLVDTVELWKVNTVSSVNKNGETVKTADLKKGNNGNAVNNVDDDEGWQTATGSYTNKTYSNAGNVGTKNVNNNTNAGNGGTRDANKKSEPVSSVNGGTIGKLDETVVANEDGKSINKNKGISNDSAVGKNGNRNTGNGDLKKNTVNNRSGSKNDIGVSKGNETNKGRKGGNEVKAKESLGFKSVVTSNRFDILGVEGVNEVGDPWKEVKDKVATACNTNVPIKENVLKGWNDDMIRFYSVKWNNRSWKNGSVKQQFEAEIKSLSSRIAQISRNINLNSKVNAEKLLKNSVLTNQDNSDKANLSLVDVDFVFDQGLNMELS
ncbi:hypothetical protein CTI12_AA497970 [Artemisia annua]|uniref:Uncharacterized protein n=1 Tax=Artemisia annua TaxID=35608 RepID=A0A2U1LEZ3_ARTAN|nr:hypothetical protein CTI12_AA497970 [Artemisia annua]